MSECQISQIKGHKRTLSLCIVILLNKERKNDLEVAHPHCGSSTTIPIELEFGNQTLVFEEKGKLGYSKKNILWQRREPITNSTQIICKVSKSGIELRPHWWEVNALTTEPSLASQQISAVVRHFLMKSDLILYLSHQSMSQVIT